MKHTGTHPHFDFDIREYFANLHLNRNIKLLYSSRLLIQVAAGMLSVFTAVFFYEQFHESFVAVMIIFITLYAFSVLFSPISAMLIGTLGIKRMLIAAVFFLPIANLSLAFWDSNPELAILAFLVLTILYRSLYWAPYHIDYAKFTDKGSRGKQMSLLLNISEVVLSVTPILGGIIIASYGFSSIFILASVFLFLSIIPLMFMDETKEEYSFGYFESFKKVFVKENRTMMAAYFGDGLQTAARIAVWPIFIYGLLDGRYVAIGIVTSLTIVLLIAVRFVLGNLEDKIDRTKLLRFGSFFATSGWFLKVFVETGFQIFVVDTYHKVGRLVNRLTFDVTTYDQAADNGHYIDEYTVLRNIAVDAGRMVMLLIAIPIVFYFGITATFIFAAGATLLMTLLNRNIYLQ